LSSGQFYENMLRYRCSPGRSFLFASVCPRCTILRPLGMTPRISCDSKESHDRLAWSTCSAEIPDTILFWLTRMAQPLVGLYYVLALSMPFFGHARVLSILFHSILFDSTSLRFLSIPFSPLPCSLVISRTLYYINRCTSSRKP
jgi:hypothetical protein